jgi:hypothetical protein
MRPRLRAPIARNGFQSGRQAHGLPGRQAHGLPGRQGARATRAPRRKGYQGAKAQAQSGRNGLAPLATRAPRRKRNPATRARESFIWTPSQLCVEPAAIPCHGFLAAPIGGARNRSLPMVILEMAILGIQLGPELGGVWPWTLSILFGAILVVPPIVTGAALFSLSKYLAK